MAKPLAPVTTSDLRSFLRSPEGQSAFDALSPEAQATVVKGARGRLHAEARTAGAKAMGRKYVEATPSTVEVVGRNDKGRKVVKFVPEAEARRLAQKAGLAGQRGPLSKAALAHVGSLVTKG